jgi:hypothetical protein
MAEIDPRIVRVGIEVLGRIKVYEGLHVVASGTKYANANQGEADIKIFNLDRETRDYILTETSPFNFNRAPKRVYVDAGRVSYGVARIFTGVVFQSSATQPPDIGVALKCLTANNFKGALVTQTQAAVSNLSAISQGVADSLQMPLDFQATDKQVGNYAYSGSALKQIDKLGEAGAVNAFVDNDTLIVKDFAIPLRGRNKLVSEETGMIGIPELTAQGIKLKTLLDNQTVVGGGMRVRSQLYPAANGDWTIYKLGFELASRDVPFYWIPEATRPGSRLTQAL